MEELVRWVSATLIDFAYVDEVVMHVHDEFEKPSNGQPLRAPVRLFDSDFLNRRTRRRQEWRSCSAGLPLQILCVLAGGLKKGAAQPYLWLAAASGFAEFAVLTDVGPVGGDFVSTDLVTAFQ